MSLLREIIPWPSKAELCSCHAHCSDSHSHPPLLLDLRFLKADDTLCPWTLHLALHQALWKPSRSAHRVNEYINKIKNWNSLGLTAELPGVRTRRNRLERRVYFIKTCCTKSQGYEGQPRRHGSCPQKALKLSEDMDSNQRTTHSAPDLNTSGVVWARPFRHTGPCVRTALHVLLSAFTDIFIFQN